VALARHDHDLWGSYQESLRHDIWPNSNVRPLPTTHVVHVCADDEVWHGAHDRADQLFAALEDALQAGSERRAARLRVAWLRQVHADRLAWARATAKERELRFDPIGRGPVVDRPTVHYRDRLPWYLTPVNRYVDDRLPTRAHAALDGWNGTGKVFDSLCIADEPRSSGHFPVHSLVATISADGRAGDWFMLERWTS
jgi:hypothetical protein